MENKTLNLEQLVAFVATKPPSERYSPWDTDNCPMAQLATWVFGKPSTAGFTSGHVYESRDANGEFTTCIADWKFTDLGFAELSDLLVATPRTFGALAVRLEALS